MDEEDIVSLSEAPRNTEAPSLPEGVWTGWLEDYRDWVLPTTDGARLKQSSELCRWSPGHTSGLHAARPPWTGPAEFCYRTELRARLGDLRR